MKHLSLTMVRFKEIVHDRKAKTWALVTRFEALGRNNAMKLMLAKGTPHGKYQTVRVG